MVDDSDQRLAEIWKGDLLGRAGDARFLIDFLDGRTADRRKLGEASSYVLNLDSSWGQGQTFFLERLQEQLQLEGYLSVYINSWRDDHADDPLVALMSALDEVLAPFATRQKPVAKALASVKQNGAAIVGKIVVGAGKSAVKRYTGETVESLLGSEDSALEEGLTEGVDHISAALDKRAAELIDGFRRSSKSIGDFKNGIAKALASIEKENKARLPLFILIDELDRCRPTYAISLLERVKHLFEVERVVFVIATDTGQLQHSVRGAYGGEFNGSKYLKRFFDSTYEFPDPPIPAFAAYVASRIDKAKVSHPDTSLENFLVSVFEAWRPDLRTFLQWMEICRNVISAWPHQHPVELALLVPVAIDFHDHQRTGFPTPGSPHGWHVFRNGEKVDRNNQRQAHVSAWQIYSELRERIFDARVGLTAAHHNPSPDWSQEYAFHLLHREFAGRAPPSGTPSVQASIPGLVRSAGRLSVASA